MNGGLLNRLRYSSLPRQLLQNLFPQLLRLAEKLLRLDKLPVKFQRSVRIEFLAQNHVAHMDRVGESRVLG